MKAFTVYPWWSWAMTSLSKAVENRKWKPPLSQGEWIAIHAGNRRLAGGRSRSMADLADLILDARAAHYEVDVVGFGEIGFLEKGRASWQWYRDDLAVRSAVVAVARFGGAYQGVPMPWGRSTGYQWRLTSLMPLARPVPVRGQQGLWTVPGAVLEQMRGQVPEVVFGERETA